MIRIIAGTYGYKDKDGFLRPKTVASEPFSIDLAEEERLIQLGVAEKVETSTPADGEETESRQASKTKSKQTSKKSS